jgi:hypothetical protein
MAILRSKPLRRQSERAKSREQQLRRVKTQLLARASGRCEGCGSRDYRLDGAHLVGRGNKGIGQPWCDLPELMAVLCHSDPRDGHVGCHERIDRALAPELLRHLRWDALVRLTIAYAPAERVDRFEEPLDGLRSLVGELERLGVDPT